MSFWFKKKIGIAFGGGGTRGFAHLGAMKALLELGIEPTVFSGTSAGAIVAVLLASGKSPDEVFEVMKKHKMTDYAEMTIPNKGFFSLSKLNTMLKSEIEADYLEDLPSKVFVCTTELLSGKVHYFDKGPLSLMVQASASIPILFAPVEFEGGIYVDGGVLDNIPIAPLKQACDKTIAISINPIEKRNTVKNMMEVASRTFQLSVNNTIEYSKEIADFFIVPEGLHEFFMLDSSKAQDVFDLGYKAVQELKEDLRKF